MGPRFRGDDSRYGIIRHARRFLPAHPHEKGWARTGSGAGNTFPVPLQSLQTTRPPRSLTRPVPLHLRQRGLLGSCLTLDIRLPNAIFNSFGWKPTVAEGPNCDARRLIFPPNTSAGSTKRGPAFGTPMKPAATAQRKIKPRRIRRSRDLQPDLMVSVFIEPHFLHSRVRCSRPLLNNIGLIRVTAISSPQAEHVAAAAISGGNLGGTT
jgi:hypothetical protein